MSIILFFPFILNFGAYNYYYNTNYPAIKQSHIMSNNYQGLITDFGGILYQYQLVGYDGKLYRKKFNEYILKIQNETKVTNNIVNYEDCLQKLKSAHIELKNISKESVAEIIDKSFN